jgi:hypothetical protein
LHDYFLSPFGAKPAGKTTDSKTDLGEIVREIDDLAVFNDEAHNIHDPRMAWFKSIQDKASGDLANYVPDFIVRTTDGKIWVTETKGRAELDLPQKMDRLKQWCADATAAEEDGQRYDFVFVDQNPFEKHVGSQTCAHHTFAALAQSFTEYK